MYCNVLRERLSEDRQNIPCATLKGRGSWVNSIYLWFWVWRSTETSVLNPWPRHWGRYNCSIRSLQIRNWPQNHRGRMGRRDIARMSLPSKLKRAPKLCSWWLHIESTCWCVQARFLGMETKLCLLFFFSWYVQSYLIMYLKPWTYVLKKYVS